MNFPPVRYMHWAKSVPGKYTYNLCASGINLLASREELNVGIADIQYGGDNFYGYPPLRSQIATWYGVPEKNILISQGTSLVNFLVACAIIQPGDEVIVESPAYEPLLTIFETLGAQLRSIPLRPENRYTVDIDELKQLLTPKTRMVVLSSLHNPTGVRITESQAREIGAAAANAGARVLIDEVYQDFAGETIAPAFRFGDNIITTSSLTKVYGLGGLRVGWAFAPEEVVRRAYEINNNMGVNNPFPSDHLGYVLMSNGAAKLVASRARERAAKHWGIVKDFLATRSDLTIVEPDGGIICFPRFSEPKSSRAFAEHLQSNFDAVVAPGYFFGDDGGFRLGFGCEEKPLRDGLTRLAQALDTFPNR